MKLFLLLSLLSLSSVASALVATSGVELCGKKATLYAFYEGTNPLLHNYKMWEDDKNVTRDQYLQRAKKHLLDDAPKQQDVIQDHLAFVIKHLDDAMVSELPTYDINTDVVFLDKGCKYKAVSLWDDKTNLLVIDKKIFKRLTPMGQAGLIFLEAISKLQREISETPQDSDFPRQLTAKIFSYGPILPPISDAMKTSEGSKPYCTRFMKQLGEDAPILVKSIELCKSMGKTDDVLKVNFNIKRLMTGSIDDCLRDCHWDEAIQVCQDYHDLINKKSLCV